MVDETAAFIEAIHHEMVRLTEDFLSITLFSQQFMLVKHRFNIVFNILGF